MTGSDDSHPAWNSPPAGGPAPQYNPPYYSAPGYQQPPQYPPPQPQYPYPPQYPPLGAQPVGPYPPPQPYGQPQPQQPQPQYQAPYQQPYGQPVVIPIEGKGVAKLGARLNPRSLTIAPQGFAHEGKQGSFHVAWSELQRVTITTAYHQDTFKILAPKVWRVRVVMDIADPSFPQRHPEIAGLQGKYGGSGAGSYGLPLGPVQNIVGSLAQAFATYGGQVFGGVIEEGHVMGLGYL